MVQSLTQISNACEVIVFECDVAVALGELFKIRPSSPRSMLIRAKANFRRFIKKKSRSRKLRNEVLPKIRKEFPEFGEYLACACGAKAFGEDAIPGTLAEPAAEMVAAS